jgi:hypothetical protein
MGVPRGVRLQPEQRASHDDAVATMPAALGEDASAAAWAEGWTLPVDEAVALALEGSTEVV